MRKTGLLALILLFGSVFSPRLASQVSPSKEALYAELRQPTSTDKAAEQLLRLAKRDNAVREYLDGKLPEMIESPTQDEVWVNAVRLAGELNAPNTLSSLIKVLPHSRYGSTVIVGFADSYGLANDPVGKALYRFGDSAVPELSRLLGQGKRETRVRVARILWNIDSPAARKALKAALENDTDPAIKLFENSKSS